MDNFDYKFVFEDLIDGYSSVTLTKLEQVRPVQFAVSIDDSITYLLSGRCLSPIQADLFDLATVIHFADKLALPKKKRSINIHIHLPVRCPEVLMQACHELNDLLDWYTHDSWHFHFLTRKANERMSERPPNGHLGISEISKPTEFALWSGGLDSLAGLQTRLLEDHSKDFALIGTGSNHIMQKMQQQVFQTLHMHPHASGKLHFLPIPLNAKYENRYSQNSTHRARGIVFLLIGAVAALANGSNKLHVYENGVGALNLALPGGTGRDHSKAVHPISLMKVENFVSGITGEAFFIENPFVFSTKAEMCRSLKDNPHPIFESISCDRLHREKYIQCGFCSSCILRRQALAIVRIEDKTKYLIPHGRKPELRHRVYWDKVNQQISVIDRAIGSSNAWSELSLEYVDTLPETVCLMGEQGVYEENDLKDKFINLYRTYVQEWRDVSCLVLEKMTRYVTNDNVMEEGKWQQMCWIKSIHVN